MSESLRLFIAAPIAEQVKNRIAAAQTELRKTIPATGITWSRPEQFHLTMQFLGNVDVNRVTDLQDHLSQVCRRSTLFHLAAEGIGAFPDPDFPRVIWAGLIDPSGALPRLHEAILAATSGFTEETRAEQFTGHVTLARVKRIHSQERKALANVLKSMRDHPFGEWTVDQIELVRSELSSDGARHNTLASFPLGTTASSPP